MNNYHTLCCGYRAMNKLILSSGFIRLFLSRYPSQNNTKKGCITPYLVSRQKCIFFPSKQGEEKGHNPCHTYLLCILLLHEKSGGVCMSWALDCRNSPRQPLLQFKWTLLANGSDVITRVGLNGIYHIFGSKKIGFRYRRHPWKCTVFDRWQMARQDLYGRVWVCGVACHRETTIQMGGLGPPTDKLLVWGGLEESQQERP